MSISINSVCALTDITDCYSILCSVFSPRLRKAVDNMEIKFVCCLQIQILADRLPSLSSLVTRETHWQTISVCLSSLSTLVSMSLFYTDIKSMVSSVFSPRLWRAVNHMGIRFVRCLQVQIFTDRLTVIIVIFGDKRHKMKKK